MKFSILTLFPKVIEAYINESIISKAIQRNQIEVEVIDIRSFSALKHHQVDDYQYGGGKGMVLMVEPVVEAIKSVRKDDSLVLLTTPQGKTWSQELCKEYVKKYSHLVIICGHYEGFDERILDYVDAEISIGDYVMTGGEIASLVILDSITRLVPNVIQEESHRNESFENNLLDYAVYTKPAVYENKAVPEVLISGHHANIEKFREESSLRNTWEKRPDLLNDLSKLTKHQQKILEEIKAKGEK